MRKIGLSDSRTASDGTFPIPATEEFEIMSNLPQLGIEEFKRQMQAQY